MTSMLKPRLKSYASFPSDMTQMDPAMGHSVSLELYQWFCLSFWDHIWRSIYIVYVFGVKVDKSHFLQMEVTLASTKRKNQQVSPNISNTATPTPCDSAGQVAIKPY